MERGYGVMYRRKKRVNVRISELLLRVPGDGREK